MQNVFLRHVIIQDIIPVIYLKKKKKNSVEIKPKAKVNVLFI